MLKDQFLELQVDLAAAVVDLLLGAADDLLGLRFGVAAAEMVQELHQSEGQAGGHDRHHDNQNDLVLVSTDKPFRGHMAHRGFGR